MPSTAAPADDDDNDPIVDLGEYGWNLTRGTFHSEHVGAGKIVSVIDEDAEAYDLDEVDEFVRPVAVVIELLDGIHAGSFIDIDITSPDVTIAVSAYN